MHEALSLVTCKILSLILSIWACTSGPFKNTIHGNYRSIILILRVHWRIGILDSKGILRVWGSFTQTLKRTTVRILIRLLPSLAFKLQHFGCQLHQMPQRLFPITPILFLLRLWIINLLSKLRCIPFALSVGSRTRITNLRLQFILNRTDSL